MRKFMFAVLLATAGCSAEPDQSPTVPAEAFDEGSAGAAESSPVLQEKRIATH